MPFVVKNLGCVVVGGMLFVLLSDIAEMTLQELFPLNNGWVWWTSKAAGSLSAVLILARFW